MSLNLKVLEATPADNFDENVEIEEYEPIN